MEKVLQNILGSMNIIANSVVLNLSLDKTVQGVITEIVNTTNGEYKVDYNGNIITAFSMNTDEVYSIDEKVFIKIPENNMNNKKFIEGRASSNSLSELLKNELSNQIVKEGPSWELIYPTLDLNNTNLKYCVQAGVKEDHEYYSLVIWDRDINSNENIELSDEIFLTYSLNYDKIYVGADFQTNFIDNELVGQGNYGLIFSFIARQQDSETENDFSEDYIVSYRLDINSFTGNPYSYTVFSPQETVLDLKSDYLIKLKSIILFQEKFTGTDSVDIPNICVRNIKILFARLEDLSNTLYYLKILTPNGTNLMNDNDEITLLANFLYKGQNILSENNCKCDWYILDPSVLVGTEFYEKETGPGWKHLESNGDFGQYIVKGTDVISTNKYMVKITYNDLIVMKSEIDINKYDSQDKVIIEQNTENKDIILSIKNLLNNGKDYIGDWYYEFGDGTFSEVLDGLNVDKIIINRYLTYATTTFYCQVKLNDNKICVLKKTITNSNTDSELNIEYEGLDVYNYDANGDMPIENAEKDLTLYPKLSWKDGYGTTYKIQWELNGIIFNLTDKQNPQYSMMEEMWIDTNGVLHYKIKLKYNRLYNNNTLTLKIITVDNKIFEFEKEILFIKTGDQGTNGTKYVSAVRPVDENLDKISGFSPIVTTSSLNFIRLRNFIYKDGELINNNEDYTITFEWETEGIKAENPDKTIIDDKVIDVKSYNETSLTPTFNITVDNNSDNILVSLNSLGTMEELMTKLIIKCKATVINNKILDNEKNEKVILYYNFPIPIITKITDDFKSHNFDVQIPLYIKYDSNGKNATYENEYISLIVDNIDYTDLIESKTPEVLTLRLVTDEDGTNKTKLVPAGTYNYNNNGNACLVCETSFFTLYYPIMMYLNTYGNEAINGWDGTNIAIYDANDDKAGYILAPLIGAGTKDNLGKFTGVIMGADTTQINNTNTTGEGLYGYLKGVNTFGILSTGNMYLGRSIETGRIDFSGNTGKIWGGGGGSDKNGRGMTIKLSNYIDDSGKPITDKEKLENTRAIEIANEKFYVTYGGNMTTVDANIGGWIINEYGIFSPDTAMDKDKGYPNKEDSGRMMLWSKNPYDPDYSAHPEDTAIMVGNQGKIGGWVIKPSGIFSPDTKFDEDDMPPDNHTGDGVIMLFSKQGSENGYASLGGWIVKKNLITSLTAITMPNTARVDTRLDAKEGIITTEFFRVNYHKNELNNRDGYEIGTMGTIEGKINESTGQKSYNLGIATVKDKTTSIILDASEGNTVTLRAGNFILADAAGEIYIRSEKYGSLEFIINNNNNKSGARLNGKDYVAITAENLKKAGLYISGGLTYLTTDGSGGGKSLVLTDGSISLNGYTAEQLHNIYCRFA